MAQSKSTKKFEKNHLKDILKKRKEHAKVKQKQQIKAKRKARIAEDHAPADGVRVESNGTKSKIDDKDAFGDMSMDQFFQGGFQVPEAPAKKSKTKPKTGKRKRTPVEEEHDSSSNLDVDQAVVGAEDSESDSGSGEDMETHKQQLAALANTDPEFYKHLQEEDPELLEFAEDADLAEIDALSASEDDERTPKKKKKTDKTSKVDLDEGDDKDVTEALVRKWKTSMEKNFSMRAMKEVVLAFRAAAHLNEDDGKSYKYSIADSNGKIQIQYCSFPHV